MEPRDQVLEFLSSRYVVTLVTIDKHGYPTGRRVGFVHDSFLCWVPTPKRAVKLQQLARHPKALLSAFDPPTMRYLQIKADIEVDVDDDHIWMMRERYTVRYPRTAGNMTPESRTEFLGLWLRPYEVRADSIPGPGQTTLLRGADLG